MLPLATVTAEDRTWLAAHKMLTCCMAVAAGAFMCTYCQPSHTWPQDVLVAASRLCHVLLLLQLSQAGTAATAIGHYCCSCHVTLL